MRLYAHIIINTMQSSTAYRFHTVMSTLNRFVGLFVMISLWTALYKGAEALNLSLPQATLEEMWLYVVYSTLIAMAVSNNNIYGMSERIQTGDIAFNLIRPIGLFRTQLCETIGAKAFVLLFEILPVLLAGHLLFGLSIPQWQHAAAFIGAFLMGFMLYFLLTFLVGLSSFWYFRTFHLEFMLSHVINFFSGVMIPLWFFPRALYAVTAWLPFDLIYYRPLSILLGKADAGEMLWIAARGCLWIAVLAVLCTGVWQLGKYKLVVQGG